MDLSQLTAWLGAGLAWTLAITPASQVNPGYFRSSLLVVLGLIVTACLAGRTTLAPTSFWILVAAGVFSYLTFAVWMMERIDLGKRMIWALSAGLLVVIGIESAARQPGFAPLAIADSVAGTCLLGTSLGAMLLGHYYLTAPWMSLDPLYRLNFGIVYACGFRLVVAIVGLGIWRFTTSLDAPITITTPDWLLYGVFRWGVGIFGPALLALMVRQTLHYKNTQAATGILYVVVIFALIGEAAGISLDRIAGVPL